MNIYLAMALGFVAASLADWLFMGILFHDRYMTFPEVWRSTEGEKRRIFIAQAFSALTAVAFVLLASRLQLVGLETALKLAVMIWLIGPLPLLLGNHLFIKLDPLVTTSHAVGWLVKLLAIGAITALLLSTSTLFAVSFEFWAGVDDERQDERQHDLQQGRARPADRAAFDPP